MTASSLELNCSVQTAVLGEQPAGTAGSADRYVMVELPLPWPAKIDQHQALAGVKAGPAAAGSTRILGVSSIGRIESTPVATAGDSGVLVACWSRTPGAPFREFVRHEARVDPDDLVATLTAINNGHLDRLGPPVGEADDVVDVLICTHGSRDRCCGQKGTGLFLELLDRWSGDDSTNHRRSVRLWRTSHTGGHRFAPTGMTFPDGHSWADLDAATVDGIVHRQLGADRQAEVNRGCGGIDGRAAQIADASALAKYGWRWLDHERTVAVTNHPSAGVELDESAIVVTVSSEVGRGRFEMVADDPVPVPICGESIDNAVKSTASFRIVDERWS